MAKNETTRSLPLPATNRPARAWDRTQPVVDGSSPDSAALAQPDNTDYSDALQSFCLNAMARLYLDAPIPLTAAEADREILAAYRLFSDRSNAEDASQAFREAWKRVLATWDTNVAIAADRLWEVENPNLAKARMRRAMAIFSAHAELQIRCPDQLPPEAWAQAKDDSCRFVREHVTDAIQQAWSPESLYGVPAENGTGLIYFLRGQEIVEFCSNRVLTVSGREFLSSRP